VSEVETAASRALVVEAQPAPELRRQGAQVGPQQAEGRVRRVAQVPASLERALVREPELARAASAPAPELQRPVRRSVGRSVPGQGERLLVQELVHVPRRAQAGAALPVLREAAQPLLLPQQLCRHWHVGRQALPREAQPALS
jgi:hypothetical protein